MIVTMLVCTAQFSTLDANRRSVFESAPLIESFHDAASTRYEADLEGKSFSVILDRATGDALVMITTAPEYTKGSATRAHADATGKITLSEVDGPTVHKLVCDVKKAAERK